MLATMNHTSTKLAVRGLSKIFPRKSGPLTVLDDINIDIQSGEFYVIVGASGCGKTTLLRTIQGLEKPSTGSIEMDGRPLIGPGHERGFVFQNDSLFPWRTTLENVTFGLEVKNVPKKEAVERASQVIRMVGLAGFEDSYPYELSGGMRQRVNLARAFAIDPDILLMDEPFAALDALTRERMQQELMRIVAEAGKTVIFITHQIDEAVLLADRVAVLGARPGHVKDIIPIEFPRPRALDIKRSQPFQEKVEQIWEMVTEGKSQESQAH
ncbi:ABC transporter ATP-binding protein [Mesorhizobium sp. SB112]|uniref:ABC transporter ATP-binding protein n=1 Tax=Mesorhizobium sp. SB112 TaxID=3151853 RepID=UPI003263BD86